MKISNENRNNASWIVANSLLALGTMSAVKVMISKLMSDAIKIDSEINDANIIN